MPVAFFDLDRTLIDCNSGRLWVQEEWRAGNIGVRDVLWASWWLGRYSMGWEADLERAFETGTSYLAGLAESDLEARVQEWFVREVGGRLRPGAREALRRHREAGDRLVVCTSSSPYAARAAVEMFDLDDAISSVFEVRDGVFTGNVQALAIGTGKLEETRAWAQREEVQLSACSFYTDSATDVPLMEAVGLPVAVNPDRLLRRIAVARGWRTADWGRSV